MSYLYSVKNSFLLSVSIAAGCSDGLPPIQYQTQYSAIGTSFSHPLCRSDLDFIDEHVQFIEHSLDTKADPPLEIYLFNFHDLPCNDTPFGCYNRKKDYIATLWDFLDHELVHAVGKSVPFPSLFWEEGVANALSIEGTRKNTTSKLDGASIQSNSNFSYISAGHFIRWLIETRGMESVRRVSHGEQLAMVYGATEDDLAAEYERSAPYAYPPRDPCPFPDLPMMEQDIWHETLSFSCESSEATQFEGVGASVVRRVALEAGTYEVMASNAQGILIVGCHTDTLASPPPDSSHGDIMNQAELELTAFGTFFPSDISHTLTITSGLYRLAISSGTDAQATMDVTIRRL